jgi:hypothetical protein
VQDRKLDVFVTHKFKPNSERIFTKCQASEICRMLEISAEHNDIFLKQCKKTKKGRRKMYTELQIHQRFESRRGSQQTVDLRRPSHTCSNN